MKKLSKYYFNFILEEIFKAKLKGENKKYHWGIYSLGILSPVLVGTLWCIYDGLMNVEYRVEDEFIMLGFTGACVLNTYLGIKVGRKLIIKEQKQADNELIESLKKQIEKEDMERLNDGIK